MISKQFSAVAPPQILKDLKENKLLGNYHLLLAHEVVKRPQAYISVLGGAGNTIIMDNSVIELGKPVDAHMLLEAHRLMLPDVIVLPDVMRDAPATLEASCNAAEELLSLGLRKFMAVPQGNSYEETCDCAFKLHMQLARCLTWWGVGKWMEEDYGTRQSMVEYLSVLSPQRPIHLLGFSNSLVDDLHCVRMEGVTGIDSAVPVRLGLNNIPIQIQSVAQAGKRSKDYWDIPASSVTKMVYDNIRHYREWISRSVITPEYLP